MLKSIRNSLTTTVMAMTPFLLTACGDDPNNDHKSKTLVILGVLAIAYTFTVLRNRVGGNRLAA
jgi:hypothetical protein